MQDEQGRGGGQSGQVVDDRGAVGWGVHQGRDDVLTGGFSVRNDGVGDCLEPSLRRFGNCKRGPGSRSASAAVPGLPAAPRPAPSTTRGTDVHKQDRRDRAIPVAVIVVVFFVAILVAALIWLAAS